MSLFQAQDQETLTAHLVELRDRLLKSLTFIAIGAAVCWIYSDLLMEFVRRPILPYLSSGGLVFTAPMDKFMAHIKISILGGVILTCPAWIYQFWQFVSPGLYSQERKYGLSFMFSGSILFLLGVSFAYFVIYPIAFKFLLEFGGSIDSPMITIGEYLSFFFLTTVVFGLAFELPLVLVLLGMLGIIDKQFLIKYRRHSVVGLAVLSAIATPPDIISMGLMMLPMLVLYELSIQLVGYFAPKKPSLS